LKNEQELRFERKWVLKGLPEAIKDAYESIDAINVYFGGHSRWLEYKPIERYPVDVLGSVEHRVQSTER